MKITSPGGHNASLPVSVSFKNAVTVEYFEPGMAVPKILHACLLFVVEKVIRFWMNDQAPIKIGSLILYILSNTGTRCCSFIVCLLWPVKAKIAVMRNSSKSTSRQRSGNGAIRKRLPLQKPRWEKTKLTIRYLNHENIS